MSEIRTIKKHANRRLYDTVEKTYVSLEQIRDLINSGVDIYVEDAKTEEDITRTVLLQIIADCEQEGRPILSPSMLTTLIRQYGHPMQDYVGPFLENAMSFYMRQEARLRRSMSGLFDSGSEGGRPKLSGDMVSSLRDGLMRVLRSSGDKE